MSVLVFRWNDINVTVPDRATGNPINLLTDASGELKAGEMIALMGPSGSGKTTLLNVLAHRGIPPKASSSGSMTTNLGKVTSRNISKFSAYVEQEDSLIGSLTVIETVDFAAKFTDSESTASERKERVAEIIASLGLKGQSGTKVGTPLQKGISGGQKRRLSVAAQVITQPSVLFLDEPTSGLDSTASHKVIQSIKHLAAENNMMVIVSIHQPSTATFDLFDKVLFLSKGITVYNGKVSEVCDYFNTVTPYPIPTHYNPAEFILELINTDFKSDGDDDDDNNNDNNQAALDKVQVVHQLKSLWDDKRPRYSMSEDDTEKSADPFDQQPQDSNADQQQHHSGIIYNLRQTYYLTHRLLIKSRRDFLAYYARVAMYLGLAIMMGTVWLRLGTQQKNIQPFMNAIFFSGAFMSFMSVAYIPAYLEDYQLYKKEHLNGLYGPFAFVVSNFIVGIPFLFGISLLFSIVTYFMCNFRHSGSGFGMYLTWLFIDLVAAESMTVMVSTAFPMFVIALALTAFMNGLWMSVGGFLVSTNVLNAFWRYTFYWINYQRFVFQGMMFNEFKPDRVFDCGKGCQCMYASPLQDQCKISGDAVLKAVGYGKEDVGLWMGLTIALIFAYRLATYIILKIRK
ncbi:uncharacterized protein KQ657_003114 [Scheffersomyces spartinae]|uniref:ABC transporter domain-containing protein n=1 Tax=Scheffersomyces spartinae TaxID=45513 RepID=A0A9P8AG98_9ASCO|nr:uncharacterized protein KQ657_003114 [Scheffersomyces spartinae]KAG7191439.1 hypothetical protein KQ657_003114 [Scheffersomyces spartinae]